MKHPLQVKLKNDDGSARQYKDLNQSEKQKYIIAVLIALVFIAVLAWNQIAKHL